MILYVRYIRVHIHIHTHAQAHVHTHAHAHAPPQAERKPRTHTEPCLRLILPVHVTYMCGYVYMLILPVHVCMVCLYIYICVGQCVCLYCQRTCVNARKNLRCPRERTHA